MLLSKSLCEHPPKSQTQGWDVAHRASVCSAQRPGLAIAGEREDRKSKLGTFVTYNAHSYVMGKTSDSDSAAPVRTDKPQETSDLGQSSTGRR